MVNKWIDHVRQFAKENGLSYACALSTAECKASYQSSKVQKVQKVVPQDKTFADLLSMVAQAKKMKPKAKKVVPQDKAFADLLSMVEQAKQLKPKARVEPRAEPRVEPQGTVIKRRPRFQVPIYFIKSIFKKKADLNKAIKKAEKENEEATEYLSSFPDSSRRHFKEIIFEVINGFDEIRKIEEELKEPDMSPRMIASRKARLKDTENDVKANLDTLTYKGFVPNFL